jgi:O-acetyl-ADP-ribose deacetylase (regulator of RNase III)
LANIEDVKITFADMKPELIAEWKKQAPWNFYEGNIMDLEADCVITPGNSFGFMDGGIDGVFRSHFGKIVEKRVQDQIKRERFGELLIGQAIVVPTDNEKIPELIYAPSMRVPMKVPDPKSIYLATRVGIDLAFSRGNMDILIPGFGTGTGMVLPNWAIAMMVAGIEDALNPPEFPTSLYEAMNNHFKSYPQG